MLRQRDYLVHERSLDELADSLTAFVLRTEPTDNNSVAITNALEALSLAGASLPWGTPYSGAGRRLLAIAEESERSSTYAASAIGALHDRAEALRLLRRVATLDRAAAAVAAQSLDDS
ncbi:MAG: hypothetical protein IT357_12375, partial [Gemmatimonadaceae bacterium]|nr:hypothetical protein [Gemmatimonadaceae bacterium]